MNDNLKYNIEKHFLISETFYKKIFALWSHFLVFQNKFYH